MRTLLLIIAGAVLGLVQGGLLGLSFAWFGVLVFIFMSPPGAHEHSVGLLGWLFLGGKIGAGIGAIVGGAAGYQEARHRVSSGPLCGPFPNSSLNRRRSAQRAYDSSYGSRVCRACIWGSSKWDHTAVLTGLIIIISFQCECGKDHRAADEHAGKRGKCSACGNVLRIPGGRPAAARTTPPPAKKPASPVTSPSPKARALSGLDDQALPTSTTLTIRPFPHRPRPRGVGLVPVAPGPYLPSTRRFASSAAIT